nr:reverse transcriptase domain-containing protein [Tanacetum cinerariifolium]
MSSDNAQSAVTYTSIFSYLDGPSWGIPLMNAGEFPEMDPYEEVAQQGQVHPLSPAYVPDPMELDEHVLVYVSEPEHPEYHALLDDDIQVENDDEDPKEDPEEDPSKEHEPEDDNEDPEEDPNEEHEPEDSDETEPPTYDQAHLGHKAAMIRRRDDILKEDILPRRRFALTGPLPGCDVAESSAAAATRAPRSHYNFVDTVEAGHGLIYSPGHDTQTIARAADRAEDVGYARALQASKRRMATSIEEVNLRVSYQAQVRRLKIDVVRSQRTAYETELQEVHQAYLSSEARNRELLARLETLETHISRIEWQRQSAEDHAVTQMMRIHILEARARTDTVEDAESSWTLKKKLMDKYCPKGEIKKLEIKLWNLRVKGNDVAACTQRFQELALMCTKFLTDETEKVDKYISGLPDNVHGNVMSARPKTLDETIELANDLM